MARNRSRLRDRSEDLLLRLVLAGLGRFSAASAEGFGRRLGGFLYAVASSRGAITRRNISRAYPDLTPAEVARLSRSVFAHFGGLTLDLLWSLREPLAESLARVEVAGEEIARRAVASGRGVFFLASHLGNWELGALVAATRGLPMTVVVRPLDNARLEDRLRALRQRSGNVVLPKADAAREVLRVLRRGGTIGILADQHAHPPDAVVVPFFGRPASTTSSVARLADRTEALILPITCMRIAPARYRMAFEEPLDVRALPSEERKPDALTARISGIIEGHIRKGPEQWLWMHKRWRLD